MADGLTLSPVLFDPIKRDCQAASALPFLMIMRARLPVPLVVSPFSATSWLIAFHHETREGAGRAVSGKKNAVQ